MSTSSFSRITPSYSLGVVSAASLAVLRRLRASGSNVESFDFTHTSGRLTKIELKHSTNSGNSWSVVQQSQYGIQICCDMNGFAKDFKQLGAHLP